MSTVPVKVSIYRTNNGTKVTVDPFVVVIKKGDEVQWELDSDYTDATLNIETKYPDEKDRQNWPFGDDPPKDVKKGKPKKSGKTKDDAKATTRYNIKFTGLDGSAPIVFVVDPDIIIIGGSLL